MHGHYYAGKTSNLNENRLTHITNPIFFSLPPVPGRERDAPAQPVATAAPPPVARTRAPACSPLPPPPVARTRAPPRYAPNADATPLRPAPVRASAPALQRGRAMASPLEPALRHPVRGMCAAAVRPRRRSWPSRVPQSWAFLPVHRHLGWPTRLAALSRCRRS
jgi:hypothetical protein